MSPKVCERFIRGENCLEWLQDLQRVLRRDDEMIRECALTIGKWNIVETKLIPLMLESRDDTRLLTTLTTIFVMLTMPISSNLLQSYERLTSEGKVIAKAATRKENSSSRKENGIDSKGVSISLEGGSDDDDDDGDGDGDGEEGRRGKLNFFSTDKDSNKNGMNNSFGENSGGDDEARNREAVVSEVKDMQMDIDKKKTAVISQFHHLLKMKKALTSPQVLSVLVWLIQIPLSHGSVGGLTSQSRTGEDNLIIELILTLIRNLLQISSDMDKIDTMPDALQQQFLVTLDKEYFLDVLLILCQDISSKNNVGWNLLLMEIIFYLTKGYDGKSVADIYLTKLLDQEGEGNATSLNERPGDLTDHSNQQQQPIKTNGVSGSLTAILKKEQRQKQIPLSSRHSRFATSIKRISKPLPATNKELTTIEVEDKRLAGKEQQPANFGKKKYDSITENAIRNATSVFGHLPERPVSSQTSYLVSNPFASKNLPTNAQNLTRKRRPKKKVTASTGDGGGHLSNTLTMKSILENSSGNLVGQLGSSFRIKNGNSKSFSTAQLVAGSATVPARGRPRTWRLRL